MKVKMKTIMAGPTYSACPGQVVEIDNETAINLVSGGYAEFAETAMIVPQETADIRPVKAKPRSKK